EIAVEIVAAFNIEDRSHLALGANLLHIIGIQCKLYSVAVQFKLLKGMIDSPQRLLGLKASRIILLRNIQRQEECADPAFARARQIPIAVGLARAHAAALIELAVESVNVAVEDQRT